MVIPRGYMTSGYLVSRVACLLTVPRSPASPSSPKPKSITMGIDEIKPRQLAPSVGIGAADCAIVTVLFRRSTIHRFQRNRSASACPTHPAQAHLVLAA